MTNTLENNSVWLSSFAGHLKLTTLLISYTSIQNKKLKKKIMASNEPVKLIVKHKYFLLI